MLVLFVVVAMYARPVLSVADSWNDTKAEDRRLQDVQRENRRLQKRQEELSGSSEKATDRATRAAEASGAAEVTPTGTETGAVSGSDAPTESGGINPEVSDPGVAIDADPPPAEPEGGTTPAGETDPAGGAAPVAGGNSGGNTGAVSG